jgi:hypothetical protein
MTVIQIHVIVTAAVVVVDEAVVAHKEMALKDKM